MIGTRVVNCKSTWMVSQCRNSEVALGLDLDYTEQPIIM